MNFREFIDNLHDRGDLIEVTKPISINYATANVANALKEKVVLFSNIIEHPNWQVCANACADRAYFTLGLDCALPDLMHKLTAALASPQLPPIVTKAACQEVIIDKPNLADLPFLLHLPQDAGYYCASAVTITEDVDFGRNTCYHRLLRLTENSLAARIIEKRGTHTAMQKIAGDLPVAICIGVSHAIHLAAAMSPAPAVDELSVAHALHPTPLVKCLTNDLHVPADAEIVLEGRITHRTAPEGPFMDLTETFDIIRDGPVIEIDCITHRHNPIYHALLPGGLEHKLLMGMPREPTIFQAVNKVVTCTAVNITPGGASWLHAVVQIDKQAPDDAKLAIAAAFEGHKSLKHVWVVDTDIDIYDPQQVEWAVATRFQADQDLIIYADMDGSSLDPSGIHTQGQKSRTAKMGLDCTIPYGMDKAKFTRGHYAPVDLSNW